MEYLKLTHAISGFVVLIAGFLQIFLRKGGRIHRTIGQIYFWAWIPLIISGSIIGSLLITFFGLLGFYMVFTGYRFGIARKFEIKILDKIFISLFFAIALFLLIWGVYIFISNPKNSLGIIALFFGIIFSITTFQDFAEYVFKRKMRKLYGHKMNWYFQHFGRMYISFIAAITAFVVIQNIFRHTLLNWILPTVLGTILLILTNRFYYKKFKI